jgi:hypothetical protein
MEITITHRCGKKRTFWSRAEGGYVHLTTPGRPGTLGEQPTMHGGSTLMCGPSADSLRRVAWRWIHQRAATDGMCACGSDWLGHDSEQLSLGGE